MEQWIIDHCLERSCWLTDCAVKRCHSGKLIRQIYVDIARLYEDGRIHGYEVFIAGDFAAYVLGITNEYWNINVFVMGSCQARLHAMDFCKNLKKWPCSDSVPTINVIDMRPLRNFFDTGMEIYENVSVYSSQQMTLMVVFLPPREPSRWQCENISRILDRLELNVCRSILWNFHADGPKHGLSLGHDSFKEQQTVLNTVLEEENRLENIRYSSWLLKREKQYLRDLCWIRELCLGYRDIIIKPKSPPRLVDLCFGEIFSRAFGVRQLCATPFVTLKH